MDTFFHQVNFAVVTTLQQKNKSKFLDKNHFPNFILLKIEIATSHLLAIMSLSTMCLALCLAIFASANAEPQSRLGRFEQVTVVIIRVWY